MKMEGVKVGFVSDLHIDVNKFTNIKYETAKFCIDKKLDYLMIAGDISGFHKDTINFINYMKKYTNTKLYFVAGNHDLYSTNKYNSKEIYEMYKETNSFLPTNPLLIGDYAIIGDTGWYDYSYLPKGFKIETCIRGTYGNMINQDKTYIDWDGLSDYELTDLMMKSLEDQLEKHKDKKVIIVSHVVPYEKLLTYKPKDKGWNWFSCYMGTKKLGELYDKYKNIEMFIYGHTHIKNEGMLNGIKYICSPIGYVYEWKLMGNAKLQVEENVYIFKIKNI